MFLFILNARLPLLVFLLLRNLHFILLFLLLLLKFLIYLKLWHQITFGVIFDYNILLFIAIIVGFKEYCLVIPQMHSMLLALPIFCFCFIFNIYYLFFLPN